MHRLRRRIEQFAGPRWPPVVRLGLAAGVVAAGFACYRWRLMHAHTFAALGMAFGVVLLLIRRWLWKSRQKTEATH